MKLTFSDAKWQQDDSGFWLSVRVDNPYDARRFLAEKKQKKYTAEIKEWRERRSLDANAYMWVLIGKIAAAVSGKGTPVSPDDVYRAAIRDVGDNYEVMPVKTERVERWKEIWESNGTGWICEELGKSRIDGYTNVRSFYGSSTYDKAQMARLIDIVVQDCKQLGIETLPPDELAAMEAEWHE